jgi:phosphatidylglycerophosphate synthase
LDRAGRAALGAANAVTLTRAVLVGAVAALAAGTLAGGRLPIGAVVALTGPALLLDAVDGQVARRSGTTSDVGARFDMEVDAFLILVLSVVLVGPVGGWTLAIGAIRYAFVAAAAVLPWLAAPLPPRFSRKAVAAGQGVVLAVAVSDLLPAAVTAACVGLALVALVWSFGRDVRWLWLRRPVRAVIAVRREPSISGAAVPALQ